MAAPVVIGTPVSFQDNTTHSGAFNVTTYTHTTSGQNNGLVVMYVANQATNVSGMTWNGTAMTRISNFPGVSSGNGQLWFLAAPADGNNTLAVTESVSTAWRNIVVFSLKDVAQTSTLDVQNQSNGSSNTGSTSVTTTVDNDLILTFCSIGTTASGIAVQGSQVQIIAPFQGAGNPWTASSSLEKTTAGAQSTGFDWTTSTVFDIFASAVKYIAPTPVASARSNGFTLLGVG